MPIPSGRRNVYFNVHPLKRIPRRNARGKPAPRGAVRGKIEDIEAVNCFFSEFDVKDYGGKREIRQHIRTLPFPSAIIDSGGGYHVYYLLDKPFMCRSEEDLKRAVDVQYAWVEFTGGDAGAKDLARVLRVPGTTNYKKVYSPDFPRVRLEMLTPSRQYSIDWMEDLVSSIIEKQKEEKRCAGAYEISAPEKYASTALAREMGKIINTPKGGRNNQLVTSAYKIGQLVNAGLMEKDYAARMLRHAGLAAGLGEREVNGAVARGLLKGQEHGKVVVKR